MKTDLRMQTKSCIDLQKFEWHVVNGIQKGDVERRYIETSHQKIHITYGKMNKSNDIWYQRLKS